MWGEHNAPAGNGPANGRVIRPPDAAGKCVLKPHDLSSNPNTWATNCVFGHDCLSLAKQYGTN